MPNISNYLIVIHVCLFSEYCGLSGDEPLPLGQEFQAHVSCFVNSGAKSVKDKYARAGKLVEQLRYETSFFQLIDFTL